MSAATATEVTNSPASTFDWQREQIRERKFEQLGYVWKIVLEASHGAAVPQSSVAQSIGCALEFYGYGNMLGQVKYPRVAQSYDRSTLLMLDPVRKLAVEDRRIVDQGVGLPDIPDPTWVPRPPTAEELTSTVPLQQARMIPQHLYEENEAHEPTGRARGVWKGSRYLVFGPVVQILIRPIQADRMLDEGWILQCGVDPATGKHMELLIHQDTGEAMFYGGKFQIYRPG
jgi:hypothetical protein